MGSRELQFWYLFRVDFPQEHENHCQILALFCIVRKYIESEYSLKSDFQAFKAQI